MNTGNCSNQFRTVGLLAKVKVPNKISRIKLWHLFTKCTQKSTQKSRAKSIEGLTLWGGLERVKGGMVLAPSARKVWKEASRQLTITRLSPATTPNQAPSHLVKIAKFSRGPLSIRCGFIRLQHPFPRSLTWRK
jgi:hypothetical protein